MGDQSTDTLFAFFLVLQVTLQSEADISLDPPRVWLPPSWQASDDSVRGGSSRSSLSALSTNNCALFDGHLDIETLGGAGFASQFQSARPERDDGTTNTGDVWNLSAYCGLEIDVGVGDGKVYTLILKDCQVQDKRDDGRERAGVNWEAQFRVGAQEGTGEEEKGKKLWVPWSALKPTYRGKEKGDAEQLRISEIRRLGFMMRRYVYLQTHSHVGRR